MSFTQSILNKYGLDQVLTDQDDARLWAIVLATHWSVPRSCLPVSGLHFGIGKQLGKDEIPELKDPSIESGFWHGMEIVEEWCFEHTVFLGDLRVKKCDETVAMRYPRWYLGVTRPSKNKNQVTVYSGKVFTPSYAWGEGRTWMRQGSALWPKKWIETGEIISKWETSLLRGDDDVLLDAYGLDQVLTNQDDPLLWATALRKHWTSPEDPGLPVSNLCLGVGKWLSQSKLDELEDQCFDRELWRGMELVEAWCFERIDTTHLRVKKCDEGRVSALGGYSWYLDITRPSKGESRAT